MNMIGSQRHIPANGEKLGGENKEDRKQNVKAIFRKNKLVQTATLIDWVLVIRFQFVDANYLKICHC